MNKLQNLKQDLQDWRSKLDCQVKTYSEELAELKNSLNTEVEQLRSEFQELRTTLQQQQEDVTASLKNLGLQDGVPAQDEGGLAHDEPNRNNNTGTEKQTA